jgi:two-component system, sensor histidine kinase LadS
VGPLLFAQNTTNTAIVPKLKIELYNDSTFSNTLAQIVAKHKAGAFKHLPTATLSTSHSKANHWLHISYTTTGSTEYYLQLDNPRLNRVSFYQIAQNATVAEVHTGDALPFWSRKIASTQYVFEILNSSLPATIASLNGLGPSQQQVFVKISKPYESLTTNISLVEKQKFANQTQKKYLLWGVLLGLTILVVLINFFIYTATKDNIYLWFLAIIITVYFHILCASGLGFQYIWPNWPGFNAHYPQTFSVWLSLYFQLVFMQLFIGQNENNSKIFHWLRYFQYFILAASILFFAAHVFGIAPQNYFRALLYMSLLINFLVIPAAVVSIFERIKMREGIIIFFTIITVFKAINLMVYLLNFSFKIMIYSSLDVVLVDYLSDLIVLALGVVYFGFNKYKQQNEQLLFSLHANEQAQSKKIIEALEIERNRIAEDLYDDVGAMLSTAIGYLSSVLRKDDNKSKFPILDASRKLLERAVENLRTVSHNLMPKNFAALGLARSLEETINKVAQNGHIAFEYILVGKEHKLDTAKEVQIFRIAAELINDILRNSGATNATIQLIYGPNSLTLMAEDNGAGKPVHNNLTSKVDFINGQLTIDHNNSGLTAIVEIPY